MPPLTAFCLRAVRLFPVATLLLLALPLGLRGQAAITSIVTTLSTESGGTYQTGVVTSSQDPSGSATFATTNNDLAISSFTDSNGNYYVYTAGSAANATAAIVRRNTATTGVTGDAFANENGMSVWYASTGSSSTSLAGPYDTNANTVLLGNNLYVGSDNTFVNNNATTSPNQSNIERIDFLFGTTSTSGGQTISAGIAATDALNLAVFDRGNAGSHDSFNIALITGYDTNGNPIYTNAAISGLKADQITASNYGTTNVDSNFNYTLFRYDNNQGNNLNDNWNADSETGSQGAGGVVFSLFSFGITQAEINAGLTIYGYSVMGADDTTNLANLGGSNYTNAADYPTTTSDSSASDGIDLLAVNGIAFQGFAVPEPSTYGAILAGFGLLVFLGVRARAGLRKPAS
jgi:hypothetical protein